MSTVPIIGPDGVGYDIPAHQAPDAVAAGGKLAQDMVGPDQKPYLIPLDQVHDAIAKGGNVIGHALPPPAQTLKNTDAEPETGVVDSAISKVADMPGHALAAADKGVKDVASVSTPVILSELYNHFAGKPNNLDKIPGRVVAKVLPALLGLMAGPEAALDSEATEAAGATAGSGEGASATAGASGEPAANSAQSVADLMKQRITEAANSRSQEEAAERAQQFIEKARAKRALVVPNAEGQAVDAETGEPLEENPRFTKDQQQAAMDKYYEEHPEKKPTPKIIQRGANKGQVKTRKVFYGGEWKTVPVYEVPK